MALDAFLVIPHGSGNPAVGEPPPTDQYMASTFSNASVIPINNYDFAVENPATLGPAGAGAGKAKFDSLVIQKPVDTASASLFSASVTGNHFAAIQLYLRHPGTPRGVPFLAYEFQMAFVTKIDWSGESGSDASETVTFAFGALAISYQQTNPDGSQGQVIRGNWSQITNAANVQDALALH